MTAFYLVLCHAFIVGGCFLIAWGATFISSVSTPLRILSHPLFWGLVCIFFGICGIRHALCQCTLSCYKRRRRSP